MTRYKNIVKKIASLQAVRLNPANKESYNLNIDL